VPTIANDVEHNGDGIGKMKWWSRMMWTIMVVGYGDYMRTRTTTTENMKW